MKLSTMMIGHKIFLFIYAFTCLSAHTSTQGIFLTLAVHSITLQHSTQIFRKTEKEEGKASNIDIYIDKIKNKKYYNHMIKIIHSI